MKNHNKYHQLTQEERTIIAFLWRSGKSKNYIARELKRSWDTIDKELERNGEYNQFNKLIYQSVKAQKKYLKRRKESKEKYRIIENNHKIEEKLIELITDKEKNLSPEQISGRYDTVSHQTIYNWIYRMEDMKLKKKIVSNFRRKGKKYRKTSKLYSFQSITAPKRMIDERPGIINQRKRVGDFEGDTVKLNGLERFYTLVDRKSGYLILKHISDGKAETIYQESLSIFKEYGDKIKSITFDNGVEFSYHDLITSDTGIPIYFCFPYHSWERGTNENTNGLIRQYYPKNKIHDKITESDIKLIEKKLNNRPRKRLNYLTPYEVFVLGLNPEKDSRVQSLI